MPDYYNPYGGQQQGNPYPGTGPGGGPNPGPYPGNYGKTLTDQTGLPLPVGLDDATRQALLGQQGALAGRFADQSQAGYNAYGQQGQQALDYYRGQMTGQNSVSAEQLRQGLQQMYGQQMSAAAGASPRNSAMAARAAMMNMGRAGMGMAGQQAFAGLQERNQAAGQYGQLLGTLRGQDLSAATGARQNALTGYGAGATGPPQPSWIQEYGPAIAAGAAAIAASDRALKTNISPGDVAANAAIGTLGRSPQSIVPMASGLYGQIAGAPPDPTAPDPTTSGLDSFYSQIAGAPSSAGAAPISGDPSVPWWKRLASGLGAGLRAVPRPYAYPYAYSDRLLKTGIQPGTDRANAAIGQLQPYTYTYKDQALGAGPQVGIMAQDLQRAGLGQAVVRTPIGLAIDGGKLSGANTAMIAALGKRVAQLEGGKGGKPFAYDPLAPDIDREVDAQAVANINRLDRDAEARRAKQDPAAAAAQAELQRRRELLADGPPPALSPAPLPSWAVQPPPLPSGATPPPLPSWAYSAPFNGRAR